MNGRVDHPGDGSSTAACAPRHAVAQRQFVFWAVAALLFCVCGLGAAPLFDVDEGAFSEATRELLASGDWGHTTLNGFARFDKPILVYWLQAGSVTLFGLNEFALRLPSALCAWGWAMALASFAMPRWGGRAGWMAGTILLTSLGVTLIGRAATADALLNLLITLAGLDLWRYLEDGSRAPRLRAAAWIGLGLLAKGPVALLVPGAAVLVWCVSSRAWGRLRDAITDPLAWTVMLAIAAPWYIYALQRHGWAFIDGFLVRHNLSRYGGALEGHAGSPAYYLVMVPLLLLPWSVLLWPLLRNSRAFWRQPATRYLLGWAGFVLVFFSFSGTKLPHYVLYGFTPLVLLATRGWAVPAAEPAARPGWINGLVAFGLLSVLALSAGFAEALPQLSARIGDPLYRTLLGTPASTLPLRLAVAAGVLLTAVALLPGLWTRLAPALVASAPQRLAVASIGVSLLLVLVVLPWWSEQIQGPVRRLARLAQAEPGTVVQWNLHQPSFSLYLERVTPLRSPTDGERAFVRLDRLPLPDPGSAPPWVMLAEDRGYGLLRWRDAAPAGGGRP